MAATTETGTAAAEAGAAAAPSKPPSAAGVAAAPSKPRSAAGVAAAPSKPPSAARANRAATLLSTAGDEAATALLPGFLAGTLGAAPIALGLVEGAASAADGVARLGGGPLSEDPRRRRRISLGSHAGITALSGLMAIASSSWQVGALRAGASTARGLRSPQRYASVPERAGSDGYGRLFGVERSLHHLAAVAGPLLAFVLLTLVGVRSALLGSVVPGVLAVAIGLWVVRRAPAPPARASRPARLQVRAVYRGKLGRLMAGITLFELANFAAVLLILRATKLLEQGDVPFGPAAMAVLLYLLWRLAAACSSFVCGRLVDRYGPAPVMGAGVFALLAAYAGFAFVEGTVPELAACFLGAGAASGAIEAAEHVGVAQIAPEDLRWSAFGSLSAVRSFGRMTATMGAAAVWTLLGPEFGLLFAAPLMVASVGVMATGLRTRRRRRRRWPAAVLAGSGRRRAAAAAFAVPAMLAAAFVLLDGRAEDATRAASAAPVARGGPAVVATIRVGRGPRAIAVDATTGRVLVLNAGAGTLARIDPATGRVAGRPVRVGRRPAAIAAAGGVAWVAAAGADRDRRLGRGQDAPGGVGRVRRLGRGQDAPGGVGRVRRLGRGQDASSHVGRAPAGIALGTQLAWVVNAGDGTVDRLDRATGAVVGTPIGVGRRPTSVFVGGRVWVANAGDGTLSALDPATAEPLGDPITVGRAPAAVVEGAGSVWVANAGDDTVSRLDPRSGRAIGATIRVGDDPRALAVGDGVVWVANHGDDTVTRIDARTGRVAGEPVAVGAGPLGVALGAESVWVANHDDGTVTRIRP